MFCLRALFNFYIKSHFYLPSFPSMHFFFFFFYTSDIILYTFTFIFYFTSRYIFFFALFIMPSGIIFARFYLYFYLQFFFMRKSDTFPLFSFWFGFFFLLLFRLGYRYYISTFRLHVQIPRCRT